MMILFGLLLQKNSDDSWLKPLEYLEFFKPLNQPKPQILASEILLYQTGKFYTI